MTRITLLALGAGLSATAHAQELLATFDGLSSPDELGASAIALGDLDGDGFGDYAFGVPRGQSSNGNTGYVDVISGSDQQLIVQIPGTNAMSRFGQGLASGDLDGDGRLEIVIGAPEYVTPAGNVGRISVHDALDGTVLTSFDGTVPFGPFGARIANVGDIDQDGVFDIAAGVPRVGIMQDQGYVFVHSGADGSQIYMLNFDGQQLFGESVAAAGDINSDGWPDFAVGDRLGFTQGFNWGTVQIFSGADASLLRTYGGQSFGIQYGVSLADAGDIDQDGFSDLIAGSQESRRATVLSGQTGAVLLTIDSQTTTFARTVASAGDLDGDGVPDFAVGASFAPTTAGPSSGQAFAYSGSTGELLLFLEGEGSSSRFGEGLSGVGDVDGDGFDELFVGAPNFNFLRGRGQVFALAPGNPGVRCLGAVNSTGAPARLAATGSLDSADNDVTLTATNLPLGSVALMLASPGYGVAVQPGGADGNLCLTGGPIGRYVGDIFGGPGTTFALSPDLTAIPTPSSTIAVLPGDTWLWQAWYRDGGAPGTTNFTDAVEITFD